ncbi:hypothetical protein PIROE2DRAFT_10368 [Piromyces sp. E2]|nr:hypothetical protein PIROE2DRAFT_10368 [Piromyces sp. E2]|eukprot:OUM63152.1 hypothetical protein PIROE2DRAFT_10368 [Piromyces sp. E2]
MELPLTVLVTVLVAAMENKLSYIRFYCGTKRHLNEQLYSSSGSPVPYMEGLAAFFNKNFFIINSFMNCKAVHSNVFVKTSNVFKSADVVSIGNRNLTLVPYTGSDVRNSLNDNINDSWESLVRLPHYQI